MELSTAAKAEEGHLPTFIRDTDVESILRQRATAQAQPGGGAANIRSSSVPNLAQTRRETIHAPNFQRKQTTLKAAIVENMQPKVRRCGLRGEGLQRASRRRGIGSRRL